jgi:hypothetical protein
MLKLVVILSIAVLNVIIPYVGMLSVIKLNVVAPKLSPMTVPKTAWVLYYKTFTALINTHETVYLSLPTVSRHSA